MNVLPLILSALLGLATEKGPAPDRIMRGMNNYSNETDRMQTRAGMMGGMEEMNPIIRDNPGEINNIFRARSVVDDKVADEGSGLEKVLYTAAMMANTMRNDGEMRKQGIGPVFGYRKEWKF